MIVENIEQNAAIRKNSFDFIGSNLIISFCPIFFNYIFCQIREYFSTKTFFSIFFIPIKIVLDQNILR